jgi:endonuclease/exonuclease/phosphatase family metal-dependent hydrolase
MKSLQGIRVLSVIMFVAIVLMLCTASGQETVRIATYNVKFLNNEAPQERLQHLRDVVDLLDADVIGFQEIDDRDALRQILPQSDWQILLDDDSGDDQDLAIAVRAPWRIAGSGVSMDLDAQDDDFLCADQPNMFYPNRRDVLQSVVEHNSADASFHILVCHPKARVGGRANNEWRRVAAAAILAGKIESELQEEFVVLLGDFNDNPDDQSLNILEAGSYTAEPGAEENPGPFLYNLTEPLVAEDRVSHGLNSSSIEDGRINTVSPGSRDENNFQRCTNPSSNYTDILFDQILVNSAMNGRYIPGSCRIFDQTVGVVGNSQTRASDHLPVSADFIFGGEPPSQPPTTGLFIVALLPNPDGEDRGHEQAQIANLTNSAVSIDGWRLSDRLEREFVLSGTIEPSETLTVLLNPQTMPLTNSGDEIKLLNQNGVAVHSVSYSGSEVSTGALIKFDLE